MTEENGLDHFNKLIKIDYYLNNIFRKDFHGGNIDYDDHPKNILGDDIFNIRPFILTKNENIVELDSDLGFLSNLPFKCISIEVQNGYLGHSVFVPPGQIKPVSLDVNLAIIKEISPSKYIALFFGIDKKDNTYGIFPCVFPSDNDFAKNNLSVLINPYLKKIQTSKLAIRNINLKKNIFNERGQKTGQIKINQIIYCGKRYELSEIESKGIKLDYSHRFEVRGHWRKIRGIGKNRDGNYVMNGYTWVVPFEKGPENLPVIKKTRVWLNA